MSATRRSSRVPYFKKGEIERLCEEALRHEGLMPNHPAPVRIDRLIEKRWRIPVDYEELEPGILGVTYFDRSAPAKVVVAAALEREATRPAERRLRSTVAHEAGHCLLHAGLTLTATGTVPLFRQDRRADWEMIVCREETVGVVTVNITQLEWQANQAIGGFLLPSPLVAAAAAPFTRAEGLLGTPRLQPERMEEAARALAETFDVNPAVARIRLGTMFGLAAEGQRPL